MKTKKGISPLIATVLIIGFTIVLAALVMQWGGGLFNKIKAQTDVSSEISLICSSGLSNLKLTGAKLVGTNVEVTVDNANEQAISGFLFRIHKTDGSIITKSTEVASEVTLPADKSLAAFGVQKYTVALATGELVTVKTDTIGAMAKVTASDDSPHTCTNEVNPVTIA